MGLKFKSTTVSGIEEALEGMRFPLDSNRQSDSGYRRVPGSDQPVYLVGEGDLALAKKLVRSGPSHAKFQRQIFAWVTIEAPKYWWTEFDTYTAGVSKNSSSTMHRLGKEEITIDMFDTDDFDLLDYAHLNGTIKFLNDLREKWLRTGKTEDRLKLKKHLPDNFIYKKKVCISYQALTKMYKERKTHELKEWNTDFVCWVKSLPYYKELILGE